MRLIYTLQLSFLDILQSSTIPAGKCIRKPVGIHQFSRLNDFLQEER